MIGPITVYYRCTYNTVGHRTPTRIGATGGDEMCNLYLMYYTLSAEVTTAHYLVFSHQRVALRMISWFALMSRILP